MKIAVNIGQQEEMRYGPNSLAAGMVVSAARLGQPLTNPKDLRLVTAGGLYDLETGTLQAAKGAASPYYSKLPPGTVIKLEF